MKLAVSHAASGQQHVQKRISLQQMKTDIFHPQSYLTYFTKQLDRNNFLEIKYGTRLPECVHRKSRFKIQTVFIRMMSFTMSERIDFNSTGSQS